MSKAAKPHTFWLIGAGLLLISVSVIFIAARGGLVNALSLPPTRDLSTPESQNGYTLLAVQRPSDGTDGFRFVPRTGRPSDIAPQERYASGNDHPVAGLWIRLPDGDEGLNAPHVTGHASSGQDFPLAASYPSGSGRGDILFTSLPGGYPGHLDFVDVSVSDSQGRTARWRISRLPVMRHVIEPPVTVNSDFSAAGIHLTLRATRRVHGNREYVHCQLFPDIAVGSHQWELKTPVDNLETDWMPFATDTEEKAFMILTDADVRQDTAFNHGAAIDQFIQHPYVRQDHYVRIQSQLTQFDTYDEKVTFHGVRVSHEYGSWIFTVPQSQSVVTPSGVRVTLPVQGKATFMRGSTLVEPGLLVDVQPVNHEKRLPDSPLGKEYGGPITISLQAAEPYGTLEQTIGPGARHKIGLFVPAAERFNPAEARDLTLIVRQRVDLHTTPVTLTVPITDATASPKP